MLQSYQNELYREAHEEANYSAFSTALKQHIVNSVYRSLGLHVEHDKILDCYSLNSYLYVKAT